jgi:thiol-disulfide isomerase/thioredoxin
MRFRSIVAFIAAFVPFIALAEEKPAAADADALWKQIEDAQPPAFNADKQKDREYVQKYFKDVMEATKKRGELAKQFVEKYPDHAKKPEALHIRAVSMMQTRENPEEFEKTVRAFVEAAPKDERGAMLLFQLARRGNEAELFKEIIEKYPTSQAAAMAKGQQRQTAGVGKPFELAFDDAISGKKISMADLKGKVVVIDFWATWCGPCVAEMPEMKKLYAEYKDKGVEFIGVSLDSPEDQGGLKKLKEFVAEKQITWPQYYQGKGWESEFSRSWGINGIPTLFIVDAEGNLHSTQARGQLESLIPELLKKAGKEVSLR